MDDTTSAAEDISIGDLGGSQDMMRATQRAHPRVWSMGLVTHPDKHGMNLGSAERALDLYGGDGDDSRSDSDTSMNDVDDDAGD